MSDRKKSAFVIVQKDDYILGEEAWETTVPLGVVNAVQSQGDRALYFVGHTHYEGKLRSVFETTDKSLLADNDLEFLSDRLSPLGHVKYPSTKEYEIALQKNLDSKTFPNNERSS